MSSDYVLYALLVLPFAIPVAVGILWWRFSADRWWMHVLFAFVLVACLFAVNIAIQFLLVATSGRLEGYPFLVLPLYAGTAASGAGYFALVIWKAVRRMRIFRVKI